MKYHPRILFWISRLVCLHYYIFRCLSFHFKMKLHCLRLCQACFWKLNMRKLKVEDFTVLLIFFCIVWISSFPQDFLAEQELITRIDGFVFPGLYINLDGIKKNCHFLNGRIKSFATMEAQYKQKLASNLQKAEIEVKFLFWCWNIIAVGILLK